MQHPFSDSGSTVPKSKRLFLLCIIIAVLLVAYLGVCAYATYSGQIWPKTYSMGIDIGGLSCEQASHKLEQALPNATLSLYLTPDGKESDHKQDADVCVSLAEWGVTVDTRKLADAAYAHCRSANFFGAGWRFIGQIFGSHCTYFTTQDAISIVSSKAEETSTELAQSLSRPAQDIAYEASADTLLITKAKDGCEIEKLAAATSLSELHWIHNMILDCPCTMLPAKTATAQAIHDEMAGQMQNATYDKETDTILPEKLAAAFDVSEAESRMKEAAPGETVHIPATVTKPTVTAVELKKVLFRDVLGTYRTHVSGSTARINNIKLSSGFLDGVVMNAGDVFDYNQIVGERTQNRGFQPAPSYVKGKTVMEYGGGVCQPSSTLYVAALLANLKIVERAAHRYVSAYVPKGLDATVSWGGPNFQFENDTLYPIKLEAIYQNHYLTLTIYGTKTDDTSIKMTNKVLSTIPSGVTYKASSAITPGAEQISQHAYTGYKVKTYRNLYDGDGNLLSTTFEADSNYRARDKIVLVATGYADENGNKIEPTILPIDPSAEDPLTPINPTDPESPTDPLPPDDTVQPDAVEPANDAANEDEQPLSDDSQCPEDLESSEEEQKPDNSEIPEAAEPSDEEKQPSDDSQTMEDGESCHGEGETLNEPEPQEDSDSSDNTDASVAPESSTELD